MAFTGHQRIDGVPHDLARTQCDTTCSSEHCQQIQPKSRSDHVSPTPTDELRDKPRKRWLEVLDTTTPHERLDPFQRSSKNPPPIREALSIQTSPNLKVSASGVVDGSTSQDVRSGRIVRSRITRGQECVDLLLYAGVVKSCLVPSG